MGASVVGHPVVKDGKTERIESLGSGGKPGVTMSVSSLGVVKTNEINRLTKESRSGRKRFGKEVCRYSL